MSISSIKARSSFAIVSNILRGGVSFLTGLIVARSLGPDTYGNYVFLIGSFIALRQFLDLGTSSAFFTFLSNIPQGLKFLFHYALWQLFSFSLPVLVISLFLPEGVLDKVWLGNDKNLVLLGFIAVFAKEQAWNTIIQLGESNRLSRKVQIGNILIATAHFFITAILWQIKLLSIQLLFILIISEYAIAIFFGFKAFYIPHSDVERLDGKAEFKKYYTFCLPLIFSTIMGAVYEFLSRWMLQKLGGPEEHAYYGISYQFSGICLLITISLQNILWKEIAEAYESKNFERIHYLFKKVSRFLYFSGAVFCGFFFFWSDEIIRLTLGHDYLKGSSTLSLMLIYPVHLCLGRLSGIMLLATKKTRLNLYVNIISMVIGLPAIFFFIGPKDAWIPGLELGAMGFALQMIMVQVINANLAVLWIDRTYGWKFDWVYQLVSLGTTFSLGWLAFDLANFISNILTLNIVLNFGLALVLYSIFIGVFLWGFPRIAGLTRDEIHNHFTDWFIH